MGTVEVATVKAYAQAVPDDFLFAIKAPNAITLTQFYSRQPKHYADYANRPNTHFLSTDLLNRFLETLAPMGRKVWTLDARLREQPLRGLRSSHAGEAPEHPP